MAIDANLADIGSGYNRTIINDNFERIQTALNDAISRSGTSPNYLDADLDLNSNDILNAGNINVERLYVDGEEFTPGDVIRVGDKGWSPQLAIVTDSARRVLQLTGWIGGEGVAPTSYVGMYVGATGFEALIANGVDIRGAQGASGPGSGDMLAAQNLNDVASKPTAFANIKQDATETATGVVELATTAEVVTGVDTTRAVTAAGVQAKVDTLLVPSEVKLTSGTATNVTSIDFVLSAYTAYQHIRVVMSGVSAVSPAGPNLGIRYSTNGGASFNSGGTDYNSAAVSAYTTDNSYLDTLISTYAQIEGAVRQASSTTGLDFDIVFYDWQNSTSPMKYAGQFVKADSAFAISVGRCGGYRTQAQANNAIRFLLTTGNIASAKYTVYGIT